MAINNKPAMDSRTIDAFKSKLVGGGARPNLFEVELQWPSFLTSEIDDDTQEMARFMVKAANLPASNITPIDVPFRGRNLKIAGDRTFDVWTITIINDTDFKLRNAFEIWMNGMNKHQDATGVTTPTEYQRDAYVYQLGRNANDGSVDLGSLVVQYQFLRHISSTEYSRQTLVQLNFRTINLILSKSLQLTYKFSGGMLSIRKALQYLEQQVVNI